MWPAAKPTRSEGNTGFPLRLRCSCGKIARSGSRLWHNAPQAPGIIGSLSPYVGWHALCLAGRRGSHR